MMKIDVIRQRLIKAYKRLGNWRTVGKEFGISGGMAFRIAQRDYEPRDPQIRARLGLESYGKAPVCPRCGMVHVSQRCTAKPKKMGKVSEMPEAELRWRLENREELTTDFRCKERSSNGLNGLQEE